MKSADLRTLGLQSGASEKDMKAAYRRLARKLHPDVNSDSDAEERFRELEAAYDRLTSRTHVYEPEVEVDSHHAPNPAGSRGEAVWSEAMLQSCMWAVGWLQRRAQMRGPDAAHSKVAADMLREGIDSFRENSTHRLANAGARPPIVGLVERFLDLSYEAHTQDSRSLRVGLIDHALGFVGPRRVEVIVGRDARAGAKEVAAARVMALLTQALLEQNVVRMREPVAGYTDAQVVADMIERVVLELEAG